MILKTKCATWQTRQRKLNKQHSNIMTHPLKRSDQLQQLVGNQLRQFNYQAKLLRIEVSKVALLPKKVVLATGKSLHKKSPLAPCERAQNLTQEKI